MSQPIINRLNRLAGQIQAIAKMLDDQPDCAKVIMQFQAAKAALESCFSELLNQELKQCLLNKEEAEISSILKLIVKK